MAGRSRIPVQSKSGRNSRLKRVWFISARKEKVKIMKKVLMNGIVTLGVVAASGSAFAYETLVPWGTVEADSGGTSHFAAVVDGNTSYHQLLSPTAITRVDMLDGDQTSSVLVTVGDWFDATGEEFMSTFYGLSVTGDFLQFADTTTDAVWRVDTTTGEIISYVKNEEIAILTGEASVQCLSPADTAPSGELAFYEGQSDSILITAGQNQVEYLITSAELIAATGNDRVSGGLCFDDFGNLYWGSNTSDDLWRRKPNGVIDQVLSTIEIKQVSGGATVGWKDIFAAPDGWVYFQETVSDHVMRFEPGDPANTLEIFLSKNDLLSGPMNSDNVISLTWFDGSLAFHTFNLSDLFYVPQPCPLDFDGNGSVGPGDVGVIKNEFGCDMNEPQCAMFDLDENGAVGPGDVGVVKNAFGPCP